MSGKLTLVPTPIGNLGDITLRAIETLKSVDTVLAEDTRTSGVLLRHYSIETPLRAYHAHNEHASTEYWISQLQNGAQLALISDAGTPGISDPGFLLLRECIAAGISTEVLPGPVAFIPALLQSGLPNHHFVFLGFLPVKKGRQTLLTSLQDETRSMIFYESPHKINKTLKDFMQHFGPERQASVSRELTKKFEETIRGSLAQIAQKENWKGEIVMVVAGKDTE
ncbi:MAG: 16S rRNA (cytidine(1402)-2'-O)-methyltransferase [Weeksellaceae bacterium]|nr:16S rRNA (cytidine(1402)-2'-O)-methyltransferase [Weeksellaceae bacterium]